MNCCRSARAISHYSIACLGAASLHHVKSKPARCSDDKHWQLQSDCCKPWLVSTLLAGAGGYLLYSHWFRRDLELSADDIKRMFSFFDCDGDGFITAAELRHIMNVLGKHMSSKQIETMIAEADNSLDQRVNFEEFAEMLRPLLGSKPWNESAVSHEWRVALRQSFRKLTSGNADPWEHLFSDSIPVRTGTRMRYNAQLDSWTEDRIEVKLDSNFPFAQGGLRKCFRMKKMSTHHTEADILDKKPSTQWKNQMNYVAKLYKKPALTLKPCMEVIVLTNFTSNSKNKRELPSGEEGRVLKIDQDGDAFIEFKTMGRHWVFKRNYGKLRLLGYSSVWNLSHVTLQNAQQKETHPMIKCELPKGEVFPVPFEVHYYPNGLEKSKPGHCAVLLLFKNAINLQVRVRVNSTVHRISEAGPEKWKAGVSKGRKNFCKSPSGDVSIKVLLMAPEKTDAEYTADQQLIFFKDDLKMQMKAKALADAFNSFNPPKTIEFLDAYLVKLDDGPLYWVEAFVPGSYVKHNNNMGYVGNLDLDTRSNNPIRATPQAFSHFTAQYTRGRMMVVDMQGVDDLYTDPQVHTCPYTKEYGIGNSGIYGMARFFGVHECNDICRHLKLEPFDTHPQLKQALKEKVPGQGETAIVIGEDEAAKDEATEEPMLDTQVCEGSEEVEKLASSFEGGELNVHMLRERMPYLFSEEVPFPQPTPEAVFMGMLHTAVMLLISLKGKMGPFFDDHDKETRRHLRLYHIIRSAELGDPTGFTSLMTIIRDRGNIMTEDQVVSAEARWKKEVKDAYTALMPCDPNTLISDGQKSGQFKMP